MLLRLGNFAKLKKLARSQVFFFSKMTFDKHLVLLSSTSTLVQKERERDTECVENLVPAGVNMT